MPQDDPVTAFRKIYLWFKENISCTGALEYSIMPDIPEYVIKNRRGEVEWKGGNIYYDKWDYDMNIEYLKRSGNE